MSLRPNEDVKARLRPFGIVFEKSLRDLIKGIRANKEPEAQAKFLQNAINECRQEVKLSDMDLKTMAILKLCYLEMYGFDMSWANFNVLEVMSSSKFQQKRVGYLAASQAFRNDDDVLMLTTNLLKKDLNSSSVLEVGVALSGTSAIVTPELASDVTDDIIKMLNHSKPYVRKKAVLALYKIFLQYPEALRVSLDRLCDKLDDPDDSVMAATVTVICELAKKTPKLFVHLAPRLYDILSTTVNNWVIIRLLKLFSSLAQIEPRLKARLIPKILEIIEKTKAPSLVYECINCIVVGEMLDDSNLDVAKICVDNLKSFFSDDALDPRMSSRADPNLQFVGLLTLNKIAKIQPDIITIQSDIVIGCLNHDDLSIREQALELLAYIISEDNLEEIVSVLIAQILPPQENGELDTKNYQLTVLSDGFKANIINKILDVCILDNYNNITDFDWFVSVLTDLVRISSEYSLYETGYRLGEELRNVLVKIPSIRTVVLNDYIVELINEHIVLSNLLSCVPEILWAVGEYSTLLNNPSSVLFNLIKIFGDRNAILSEDNQADVNEDYNNVLIILIPALVKIFNAYSNLNENYMWNYNEKQHVLAQLEHLLGFLTKMSVSRNFNIQERAIEFLEFLKLLKESLDELEDDSLQAPLLLTAALPSFFDSWELNPISRDVQKKLQIPDELDLDAEIYPVNNTYENYVDNEADYYLNYRNPAYQSDSESELSNSEDEFKEYSNPLLGIKNNQPDGLYHDYDDGFSDTSDAVEKRRQERLERQKYDPFYLSDDKPVTKSPTPEVFTGSEDIISIQNDNVPMNKKKKKTKKAKPVVLAEENILGNDEEDANSKKAATKKKKSKKNILKIDTSGLENFEVNAINSSDLTGTVSALHGKEVEYTVGPVELEGDGENPGSLIVVPKKKKTKKKSVKGSHSVDSEADSAPIAKKKLKKKPKVDAEGNVIEVKKKSKKKAINLN